MNEAQLSVISFFVKSGYTIDQACKRIGKTRSQFYMCKNKKVTNAIVLERLEYRLLYLTQFSNTEHNDMVHNSIFKIDQTEVFEFFEFIDSKERPKLC